METCPGTSSWTMLLHTTTTVWISLSEEVCFPGLIIILIYIINIFRFRFLIIKSSISIEWNMSGVLDLKVQQAAENEASANDENNKVDESVLCTLLQEN